ncbi:hypothetical protein GCM10010191_05870 [Actinomadura vinacea]|uniref:HEAT repeat domain-containing protein n=1 Tax=Actinomadura vinacea TaxID=115336 RepID=A0ABP5VF36_9ACTN
MAATLGELVRLVERLESGDGGAEAAAYAARLPREPLSDAAPEEALALARLHLLLRRHLRDRPWPRWREAVLPEPVRIAWLRAEIAERPETVAREPADEPLYQAVHGLRATDVDEPERLARVLLDGHDPALLAEALRITREAVRAALLAPSRARPILLETAARDGAAPAASSARKAALHELAEPWAALEPLPGARLRRILDTAPDPDVAAAAIEVAARHRHRDLLLDVATDARRPPGLRRRSLELAGGTADREDVPVLVGIAAQDPLLLAGPAVRCLLGMHRRALFPSGADVPSIVGLVLADHSVPAHEPATLLFTCRNETLRELAGAPPGDASWPRRLELLVALAEQGTGDLPIGETIAGLLPAAPDPEPFLEAIRTLRHAPAERAVLAVLPRSPDAALRALEAVGGSDTAAALRTGLGLDGTAIAPHLRPVRHRALALLWHLTDDAGERSALLARLDPRDLPRGIRSDLGWSDARELELLRAGLDPDEPVEALCLLARNGDAGTLPAIADLLLRVVSDLAASRAPDDAAVQNVEPRVPDKVPAAIRDLGGRLHTRGKIRPHCLLDATGPTEAGEALVATMALDLLDEAGLTAPERSILLELLQHVPSYGGIRARVHRLLRDRDRHVRKHAIALLARDAGGADARALSAGLIALTAARDEQTVRQAVLALGHARANWAAPTLAACLRHPNMNVKKAAATALADAGSQEAVPEMLSWLGGHDNPGLAEALARALRAVLGDGYAATLVAAADSAGDERTRILLMRGLECVLSRRAVDALAVQGSAAGRTLAERRVPPRGRAADSDVEALETRGWDDGTARRLVLRDDLAAERLASLRPFLDRWLEMAAAGTDRAPVLRFILRLCPPPWSGQELESFARSATTLVTGLDGVGDAHREGLLAVIEEAAARLTAADAQEVAARLRALPPEAAGGRSLLTLLRRCGAVPTRADLESALTAARKGPNPWLAEEAVLREAFVPGHRDAPSEPAVHEWREDLEAAARTPGALQRFRDADAGGHPVGSRDRLAALAAVYPTAGETVRGPLLEWMLRLQPIGAPAWTLGEDARRGAPPARLPGSDDLDQPRSGAQRERLLAMLDDPARERRHAAARALLGWPEPEIGRAVLRAYLHGRIDPPAIPAQARDLAPALTSMSEAELNEPATDTARERIALVAAHLRPTALARLLPLLLCWRENGAPATRAAVARALHRADPDLLSDLLSERLDAGEWGVLGLITGRPLLRTPALARARERLIAEGRDDLAERLLLVDGPLRDPDAAREDAAALAALRTRRPPAEHGAGPSRESLFDLARTGTTEQARRALTLLAERHDERPPGHRDPGFEELLAEAIGRPEARLRLHAHRISRKVLDRSSYLEQTSRLLEDPRPDIVRSAIRSVSHAAWKPAIPALVGLLSHARPAVRRAAADGLALYGEPAARALRHAAGRARPDRRGLYTDVLDRIAAAPSPE